MIKTNMIKWILVLIPAMVFPNSLWVNHINRHELTDLLIEGEYLWMATSNTGIIRWNTNTGERQIFDSSTGFFSDYDFYLASDRSKNICVASKNILASYINGSWQLKYSFQSRIIDLSFDLTGNLWIALSETILKQEGDSFKHVIAFDSLIEENKYVSEIVSGIEDSCVYVRVENKIFQFNTDGKYQKTIEIPLVDPFKMAIGKDGLFVTAIREVGLYKDDNWSFFSTDSGNLNIGVMEFSVSDQGDIWAYGQDLMVFENEKWVVKHRYKQSDIRIRTVAPVNGNIAWVGGAYFFGKLVWGELQQISENSPASNNIGYIYSDKDGTIWAQCGNTLSRFSNGTWTHPYARKTRGMLQTSDSVYYFIEKNGVFVYGQLINGIRDKNLVGHNFVPPGEINAISEDVYGKIWFATSEGIIQNGSDTLYSSSNCRFASSHINTILATADSSLWIGGKNGTLACYKDKNWIVGNLEQSFDIRALAYDSGCGLWIGTNKGIFTIAKPSDNIVAVEIESDLRNVSSIVIDFKKRIWVGTNEGLGCYENGKWNILRKSDGLTSNLITSLVLNKDSVLWIGTYDRGISTLNLKSYPLQNRLIKNSKKSNHLLSKYQIHFGNRKMLLENRNNFLLNGRKSSAVLSGRPTTNRVIFKSCV
jgi:hypothetical protein